jgi:hypothetical protein
VVTHIIVIVVLIDARLLFSGLPLKPPVLLMLLLPFGLLSPLLLPFVLLLLHPLGVSPVLSPLNHVLGKGWVKVRDQAEVPLQPPELWVRQKEMQGSQRKGGGEKEWGALTISMKSSSGHISG